ncbi:MAG: DUF3108 domain-containing protein [Hahellaceae bacterium]|nr:DUF3108 domain-containing protein [Hahellaceae bacterium]
MTHHLKKLSFIVLIWCIGLPSLALELTPERCEYYARYRTGLPIAGKGYSQLTRLDDHHWKYEFKIDGFFVDIEESVTFTWQPGQIIKPDKYHFRQSGWLISFREATVDFQWNHQRVRNDVEDRPWLMKIPDGTLDKLSYQLQLRLDLAAGKTDINYRIADGGLLKLYQFKVVGQEQLDTRYGKLETVIVERLRPPQSKRKTTLWYASQLDFTLVKLEHEEADGEEYQIELKSVKK